MRSRLPAQLVFLLSVLVIQPCSSTPALVYLPSMTEQWRPGSRVPVKAPLAGSDGPPSSSAPHRPPSTTEVTSSSDEVDAWAFFHPARVDPGPPPISSTPNRTAPVGSTATYGDDADLDSDLDLDLPPSRTHTLVKRALASGCYYTCPATTKPNGLNAALPLVSGSKYPKCEYLLGGLAGGGTCTYSTTDGKLTSSSGAGVAGNCQDNASTQCAAGSRSLTVRRQEQQRERDEEAERKRPSRRLKEGKVPEELEARFGLWKRGRRGRLGEGIGGD